MMYISVMSLVVYPKRKQLPVKTTLMGLVVLFHVLTLINPASTGMEVFGLYNYIFLPVSLAFYLCFLLVYIYNYLYVVFSKRSRLLADDSGLSDELTAFSVGKIPWSDVLSVELRSFHKADRFKANVLTISLKDPDAYIRSQPFWKRRRLREDMQEFGTPVVIPEHLINYDITSLATELEALKAERNRT
jgi:hypothetical protein